ncbi:TrbG/VirB9 family P-type conjugative transfer protein [Helicobacter sp. 12S02232-10]|uniref:TrbG/VirB9 family P-type conjugative transfer protein n=1 Tax=Helicobacter sp. 12S02232-10 TaxID=1476197 RepID=UPI002150DBEE|nr:TrbG/VirB9 family P-type conjugative transfer protein [Helicobacter sp. 12S02232-10]
MMQKAMQQVKNHRDHKKYKEVFYNFYKGIKEAVKEGKIKIIADRIQKPSCQNIGLRIFALFAILFIACLQADPQPVPSPFENPAQNQNTSAQPSNARANSDGGISLQAYEEQEKEQNASKMMFLNAIQNSFFSRKRNLQDNNLNIHYVAGDTHKIRLRYAMSTMFVFDNDSILYISLGDPSGFEVETPQKEGFDLSNILLIKPLLIGIDTNLTIIGKSGKIYTFYLFSTHFTNSRNPVLSVFVSDSRKIGKIDVDKNKEQKEKEEKFKKLQEKNSYLLDMKNPFSKPQESSQDAYSNPKSGKNDGDDVISKKIDYSSKEIDDGKFIRIGDGVNHLFIDKSQIQKDYYQKPKAKRTWQSLWLYKKTSKEAENMQSQEIFDDGKYTYFKFDREKSISKFPYAYKVVDQYDNPVNSRIVGNYIIAEDVGRKWTLRLGDEYVCVEKIPNKKTQKTKQEAK